MNPELSKLFYELKPYLEFDENKGEYSLKEDVSEEIKKKYEEYKNMEDDE